MTKSTLIRLGGLAALAASVLLLIETAGAVPRNYNNNRNRNYKADNFYKPDYDANGHVVVPPVTDEDKYAHYFIWNLEYNVIPPLTGKTGHKLHHLAFSELNLSKTDFDEVDANKDGFLDVKEIKAALHKFVAGAKSGDSKKDGDKPQESTPPAKKKNAK